MKPWIRSTTMLAVGGLAVLLLVQGLRAQGDGTTPSGKVACIDVVKIFNEYQRQKDLSDEMKNLQSKLEEENKSRRQKIDEFEAALGKIDPNDPTYVARMRELLQMQIEYKNWVDLKQADMTREIALWSCRIYKEIIKLTEEVAKSQSYDLVFYRDEFECAANNPDQIREQIRGRKLLYANASVDISQTVLDALNSAYRAQPKANMLFVP